MFYLYNIKKAAIKVAVIIKQKFRKTKQSRISDSYLITMSSLSLVNNTDLLSPHSDQDTFNVKYLIEHSTTH